MYDQDVIGTGGHKLKYHWTDDTCSIHINFRGDSVTIVHGLFAYKLKVKNIPPASPLFRCVQIPKMVQIK